MGCVSHFSPGTRPQWAERLRANKKNNRIRPSFGEKNNLHSRETPLTGKEQNNLNGRQVVAVNYFNQKFILE